MGSSQASRSPCLCSPSHSQAPLARHEPLPEQGLPPTTGQSTTEQSSPFRAAPQAHAPSTHSPLPEQPFGQPSAQSAPE